MDELKKLIDGTLNDESKAKDKYALMIEACNKSSLTDDIKTCVVAIIEKIRKDEKTHHEMLKVIQEIVNDN